MVNDTETEIKCALDKIVETTQTSGNMKKELKRTIYETVSTLRSLFANLNKSIEEKSVKNAQIENELSKMKAQLDTYSCSNQTRYTAPSTELSSSSRGRPGEVLSHNRGIQKSYSEVLVGKSEKLFKMILKSKQNESSEKTKQLIKTNINPMEMKVGINSFKSLREGRVLIQTSSKEDLEKLRSSITNKCGEHVEVHMPKLRNPRLIIYNIPEDISAENAAARIIEQNSDLGLNDIDIQGKFCYTSKYNKKNLVIEACSQARKELLKTKLKLGWQICKVQDYLVPTRCFKCSRYNHRHRDCTGTLACPLCAGDHSMKECKAPNAEHKCINCITYNKYHQSHKISEKHSSLDKNCPSLQAVLKKYVQNTDY